MAFGGLIDRAAGHLARAPPLDGGEDDHADAGTDTTVLGDDNDDIASFTSQQNTATIPQACNRCTRVLRRACDGPARAGPRGCV